MVAVGAPRERIELFGALGLQYNFNFAFGRATQYVTGFKTGELKRILTAE